MCALKNQILFERKYKYTPVTVSESTCSATIFIIPFFLFTVCAPEHNFSIQKISFDSFDGKIK